MYNLRLIISILKDLGIIALQLLKFVGILFLYAGFIALPLQLLWNYLMPSIFDLPEITFWQAFFMRFLISLIINTNNSIWPKIQKNKNSDKEKEESKKESVLRNKNMKIIEFM
jgi:hypothetical protein